MDQELKRLVELYGTDWARIGRLMCQTPRQVRQHWTLLAKPSAANSQYSAEEDAKILENGQAFFGKWALIAKLLVSPRTPLQIRNRFLQLSRKNNFPSAPLIQKVEWLELNDELSDFDFDFENID
jgi:hypothetical protein